MLLVYNIGITTRETATFGASTARAGAREGRGCQSYDAIRTHRERTRTD